MRTSWIATLASSVMALAMAAPAVAANLSPELKALAAAADKEGEILVMWSASTMGGPKMKPRASKPAMCVGPPSAAPR